MSKRNKDSESVDSEQNDETMDATKAPKSSKSRPRRKGKRSYKDRSVDDQSQPATTGTTPIQSVNAIPLAYVRTKPVWRGHYQDGNIPLICTHQVVPHAGFMGGWSNSDNFNTGTLANPDIRLTPLNGEVGADTTVHDIDETPAKGDVYHPVTPVAQSFLDDVWPHYAKLFLSGIKTIGTEVGFNKFIEMFVILIKLHTYLQYISIQIALTESNSGNPVLDRMLYVRGETDCVNPVFQSRVAAAMALSMPLPMLPGLVAETNRILNPFIDPSAPGTVQLPEIDRWEKSNKSNDNTGLRYYLNKAEEYIRVLNSDYAQNVAALLRFIPSTFASCNAYVAPSIGMDPVRASGLFNAETWNTSPSGNSLTANPTWITARDALFQRDESDRRSLFQDSIVEWLEADYANLDGKVPTCSWLGMDAEGPKAIEILSSMITAGEDQSLQETDPEYMLVTPHMFLRRDLPYINSAGNYIVNPEVGITEASIQSGLPVQWLNSLCSKRVGQVLFNKVSNGVYSENYKSVTLTDVDRMQFPSSPDYNRYIMELRSFIQTSFALEGVAYLSALTVGSGVRVARPEVTSV